LTKKVEEVKGVEKVEREGASRRWRLESAGTRLRLAAKRVPFDLFDLFDPFDLLT